MPDSFDSSRDPVPHARPYTLADDFCTYRQAEGQSFKRVTDKQLRPTAHTLVHDSVCQDGDAWARYFLLVFWLWQVPETASFAYLESVIQGLRSLQVPENLYLLTIHHHVIQQLLSQQQTPSLRRFLADPSFIAKGFLTAWLSEAAVQAVREWRSHRDEGFAIAMAALAHLSSLVEEFEIDGSSPIKAYIASQLRLRVRDQRFKENRQQVIKRYTSMAGKLRAKSKKQLKEILQIQGLSETDQRRYLLIRESFKDIYTDKQIGHRKELPPPSELQIQLMCDRCNERRVSLNIQPEFSVDEIQQALETMAKWIDAYAENITVVSLDTLIGDNGSSLTDITPSEDSKEELDDSVLTDITPSDTSEEESNKNLEIQMLDDIDTSEFQMSNDIEISLRQWFSCTVSSFSDQQKALLYLAHGFENLALGAFEKECGASQDITQKDLEAIFPQYKGQYGISRALKKMRLELARCCVREMKQTYPDIFSQGEQIVQQNIRSRDQQPRSRQKPVRSMDEEVLNYIAKQIQSYLVEYAQQQVKEILVKAIQAMSEGDRQAMIDTLDEFYTFDNDALANYHALFEQFLRQIHLDWNIDLSQHPNTHPRLRLFIREWLNDCILSLIEA